MSTVTKFLKDDNWTSKELSSSQWTVTKRENTDYWTLKVNSTRYVKIEDNHDEQRLSTREMRPGMRTESSSIEIGSKRYEYSGLDEY